MGAIHRYRAATPNTATAGTTGLASTSIGYISGSATKLVTVTRILISCVTLPAADTWPIDLERWSTQPSGSVSVIALTPTPFDSSSPASTVSLVQAGEPATEGAFVDELAVQETFMQAAIPIANGRPTDKLWEFGRRGFAQGVSLRGINEGIGIAMDTFPVVVSNFSIEFEWTEE